MQGHKLAIPEVILLEPKLYQDKRGFFFESFNQQSFEQIVGYKVNFVQDNHSYSVQGVLRGLHYQLPPKAQGKLVRVIQGEIFDVAVDVRRGSPTFGKWVGALLSAENKKQLWLPAGMAHGFIVLSKSAEVLYKTTEYYAPEYDRTIIWNDPEIGLEWPDAGNVILSDKDAQGVSLSQAEVFSA